MTDYLIDYYRDYIPEPALFIQDENIPPVPNLQQIRHNILAHMPDQNSGDPYLAVSGKYPAGAVIEAEVISIQKIGLFLKWEKYAIGFLPVSELRGENQTLLVNYEVGQKLKVRVVRFNQDHQKFLLELVTSAEHRDIEEVRENEGPI